MEGEQKHPIKLNSPLDVNSHDMFVSNGEPKFSFNRQKYQGEVLQNSVRYEADGWFAGWWVHNFDMTQSGTFNLQPNDLGSIQLQDRYVPGSLTKKYWIARFKEVDLGFNFIMQDVITWRDGSGTVTRVGDDIARINGRTASGTPFSVDMYLYNGNIVPGSFVCADPQLEAVGSQANGLNSLTVSRITVPGADFIHVRYGNDLRVLDGSYYYSHAGGVDKWGNLLTYNRASNSLTFTHPDYDLLNWQVINQDALDEIIRVEVGSKGDFPTEVQFTSSLYFGRNKFTDFKLVQEQIKHIFPTKMPPDQCADDVKLLRPELKFRKNDPQSDHGSGRDIKAGLSPWSKGLWSWELPIWLYLTGEGFWTWTFDHNPDPNNPKDPALDLGTINWEFGTLTSNLQNVITDRDIMDYRWHVRITDATGSYEWTEEDDPIPDEIQEWMDRPIHPITGTVEFWLTKENQDYPGPNEIYYMSSNYVRSSFDMPNPLKPPLNQRLCGDQGEAWRLMNRETIGLLVNAKDERVVYCGGNTMSVHLPLAVPAFMVFTVETMDIVNNQYEYKSVSNSDAFVDAPLKQCFRLDDGGGEGQGNWAIDQLTGNFVTPMPTQEQGTSFSMPTNGSINDYNFIWTVDNTGGAEFSYWTMTQEDAAAMSGGAPMPPVAIFGYWPSWTISQTPFERTYVDMGMSNQFAYKMMLKASKFAWLQTAQPHVSCIPDNQVNRDIKDTLAAAMVEVTEPTSGVWIQECNLWLTQDHSIFIAMLYDIETEGATFTESMGDGWTVKVPSSWKVVAKSPVNKEYTWKFTLTKSLPFTFDAYRCFVFNKAGLMLPASLVSATAQLVTLTSGYGVINKSSGSFDNHPQVSELYSLTGTNDILIYVDVTNRAVVDFMLAGIFWRSTDEVKFISISGNTIRFTYRGTTYTLTIGSDLVSRLVYSTTDIRDGFYREVYKRDMTDIYMFVKQFWSNDIEVENFWWIDSEHVLELSKHEMTLYKKSRGPNGQYLLHDWMGDRWEKVKSAPRGNFIGTEDIYYNVSCALNSIPVLFKMQNKGTSLLIKYISDVRAANFANPVWTDCNVPIVQLSFPYTLSGSAISAPIAIDVNGLLVTGKISSTCVNGQFIIGIQQNRGLLQWSLKVSGGGVSVVNGYGCVGLDGSLTGGQFPAMFCGGSGFNGNVQPLSDFKDDTDKFGADGKIFGSGTSIWFVYSQVKGIVSHYRCVGGGHVPEIIPINNNYSSIYEASSFAGTQLYDYLPKTYNILVDLFLPEANVGGIANTAIAFFTALAFPQYFCVPALFTSGVYCAQARSQICYVWRNKLNTLSEDGKDDKEITVRRHSDTISQNINPILQSNMIRWAFMLLRGIIRSTTDKTKANENEDANATADTKGRRFGAFVMQNLGSAISAAVNVKGATLAVRVETTEVINLNMFYSIDDGLQCWAGPGFVNHNFIGQAPSQSITATRTEFMRMGLTVPLKWISILLSRIQYLIWTLADEAVGKLADLASNWSLGVYVLGTGTTLPIGSIIAGILNALRTAIISPMIEQLKPSNIDKTIDALYDSWGGGKAIGYYAGGFSKHQIDVEAYHVYGQKPLSLMWPAFGVDVQNKITVEQVKAILKWKGSSINLCGQFGAIPMWGRSTGGSTINVNDGFVDNGKHFEQDLFFPNAFMEAKSSIEGLPADMACVEGIVDMLPVSEEYKNLQINCVEYAFPPPPIHDYCINKQWDLGIQAANGEIVSYSVDDVKVIDGPASNIVATGSFLGLASSYGAIEVKDVFDPDYLRPWAVTATCIALNINRVNVVQESKAYHAFDGQFNRIVSWKGGSGLDKATLVQQYCFQINDHFKRSNIIPPSEFLGNFNGPPNIAMRSYERIANQIMDLTRQKGLDINIPGEDRDATRYSLPIHSEYISSMPAMVRMLAPYKLHAVEGITGLTTELRNTQTKYKAPSSVDFNIFGNPFRATMEYVAPIQVKDGIVAVDTEKAAPKLGLKLLGPTPSEAYFYSEATRLYYTFTGGQTIEKKEVINRFKDIQEGRWDFVNQEVVFKAMLKDKILVNDVEGFEVLRLNSGVIEGEIYPPTETIYNERSGFKILSMPGGLVYQGPKRCAVNRFVIIDSMIEQIKQNKKRWLKLDREDWTKRREYGWNYIDWHTDAAIGAVYGWTHNPWRASTAMLGDSTESDCLFEWELTFAWTPEMEKLWEQQEYLTFCVQGETMTQGGTLLARPTHIFLIKALFKSGYYTTRYQSKNGVGNRERLYMWSDGIIALDELIQFTKQISSRRTQPIATSQVDIGGYNEQ